MKKFVLFFAFIAIAFACSGDCLSCHASLSGDLSRDEDHKVLLDCVICHKEIDSPNAECGGNCLSCHAKIDQSVAEHGSLDGCKNCHITSSNQSGFLDKMFGGAQGGLLDQNTLDKNYERIYKAPK